MTEPPAPGDSLKVGFVLFLVACVVILVSFTPLVPPATEKLFSAVIFVAVVTTILALAVPPRA